MYEPEPGGAWAKLNAEWDRLCEDKIRQALVPDLTPPPGAVMYQENPDGTLGKEIGVVAHRCGMLKVPDLLPCNSVVQVDLYERVCGNEHYEQVWFCASCISDPGPFTCRICLEAGYVVRVVFRKVSERPVPPAVARRRAAHQEDEDWFRG
jgi:hypothetical protein